MKCLNCEKENLDESYNFCPYCGNWTAKGYKFFQEKENVNKVLNGSLIKQDKRVNLLTIVFMCGLLLFISMYLIRKDDLFKPIIFLKKKITNYSYGYNTSPIKTDNIYLNENVNSYEDAINYIKSDFESQKWLCDSNVEMSKVEYDLEEKFNIPSVTLCDVNLDVSLDIKNVIEKMYYLFPNIKGSLTNITITNAKTNSEYIAYFQPMYEFVNTNLDINDYNKVNKTQILLNSYYFLNEKYTKGSIDNIVDKDFYVKDATLVSTIAHELGHYISFKIFLKSNNLDNITYITKTNEDKINFLLEDFNSGAFSKKIILNALNNYNVKYSSNLSEFEFAKGISNYAGKLNDNNTLIYDEVIAEAVHDYYLHEDNCSNYSKEIISIILERL